MKPLFRPLSAALLGLLVMAVPAFAAGAEAPNAPKVKLTFVDWEKFSDIAVDGMSDRSASELIHHELERHLLSLTKRRLEPGQTLEIRMKDVDLAGAIEPWRGPDFGHIRYLRDTQPPRLVFDYRLLAADGTVLMEGPERLINLTFRYQPITTSRDTTFFEKQLLSDWVHQTFEAPRKPKKSKKQP